MGHVGLGADGEADHESVGAAFPLWQGQVGMRDRQVSSGPDQRCLQGAGAYPSARAPVGTRGAVETLSRNKHTAMSFRPLLAGPSRGSVGALKTPLVRPRRYLTSTAPRVPTGALALGYALSAVI
jgi:hypothetical protein